METPPPTPPSPNRIGRILLINLSIIVAQHIGRQLLDSRAGIYPFLFLLVLANFLLFLVTFFDGHRKLSLGFLLSALLVFLIGFSDCATHLRLGNMH